jgi:tight adherence protein B
MLLPAFFFMIFLLAGWVMVLFLRPSKEQKILQQRLTKVEQTFEAIPDEATLLLKEEKLSDTPWLDRSLRRIPGIGRVRDFLFQAGSSWTVGQVLAISGLLAIAGTWVAALRTPTFLLGLVCGVAAGAVPWMVLYRQRAARFRRFDNLLSDAIDLMSRALRAGHGIVAAIEMVSREVADPVATEFRRVFEQQNFGMPLREALTLLAHRAPLPDVRILIAAILVQKETGGNLAEVLDKTAAVIRERYRLRGQIRVYTAQGRLTAWILGLMPFGMFLAMSFVNPSYSRILLEDPLGQKLIYAGLALMAVGIWAVRRVVDVKI